MKGLALLFFAITVVGIGWQYIDKPTRRAAVMAIRKNALVVALAVAAVMVAIFFAANTSVKVL